MKRNFLILILGLFIAFGVQGKQILTLTNGEELEVEIISIGTGEVTYKKSSNPDGPSYSTDKSKIFFILFDDGTKEIITPLESVQDNAEVNNGVPNVSPMSQVSSTGLQLPYGEKKREIYYDKIRFFLRLGGGVQVTAGGFKDTPYGLEFDPVSISVEPCILFPSKDNVAWYVGLGYNYLGFAKLKMFDDNHDYDLGDVEAHYLTVPFGMLIKPSKIFTFGAGLRPQVLLKASLDDKDAHDMFGIFRVPVMLDFIFTFGKFDIGPRLMADFTNTFRGEGMDWSGSFGFEVVLGVRF